MGGSFSESGSSNESLLSECIVEVALTQEGFSIPPESQLAAIIAHSANVRYRKGLAGFRDVINHLNHFMNVGDCGTWSCTI
jgi:hypothetical protein